MLGRVGYKAWSGGNQIGLRIYADTIRKLRTQMRYESQDGAYRNLDQWLRELEGRNQPARYSRHAVLMLPDKQVQHCTLTISTLPPISPQGYVTAPVGSHFAELVERNLGENLDLDIESAPNVETLILQPPPADTEIKKQRTRARKALRRLSKPAPVDLIQQGMYFEMLEFERRKTELSDDLVLDWRSPYIDSRLEQLRELNISCDIDVWDSAGVPQLCIEVKSIACVATGAFVLTRRELESREKCRTLGIPYEIVVYGFSNSGADHSNAGSDIRRVIQMSDLLNTEPNNYLCW